MAAINDVIQNQLAERLVEAARIAEDEIDREIERLEKLDEDDLEGESIARYSLNHSNHHRNSDHSSSSTFRVSYWKLVYRSPFVLQESDSGGWLR